MGETTPERSVSLYTGDIFTDVRKLADALKMFSERFNLITRQAIEKKISDINAALKIFGKDLPADEVARLKAELVKLENQKLPFEPALPPMRQFKGLVDQLPKSAQEVGFEFDNLDDQVKDFADKAGVSTQTVIRDFYELQRSLLAMVGVLIPAWPEISAAQGKAAKETKSFWTEVSTIAADSARNIVGSLLDVFDIHKLLIGEAEEFDNSYYEALMAAADEAYDSNRSRIQEQLDALKDATSKEIDLIKSKYEQMVEAAEAAYNAMKEASNRAHDDMVKKADRAYQSMMDAAKRAFDANELRISRAQEDADRRRDRAEAAEDRKYEREYERRRKDIENSSMSSKEKAAALLKLEQEYEKAKEARDRAREEAEVARERKREDAKIARQKHYDDVKEKRERHYEDVKQIRERHYDDVQRIREINQENKLEAIRAAGRAAEQALRDAAQLKEQEFLTNLLNLDKAHEDDKDNLRAAEELARQQHADDEERRQKSLWTGVKKIFGTAVEEMLTVWLTGPNSWLGGILSGTGQAQKAIESIGGSKGLGGLAETAKNMSGGFLSALGSVGSIISGIVGLLELLKGPQKQTDVTYWLKLQWELQQEIHDFLFIDVRKYLLQDMYDFMGEGLLKQDATNGFLYNILPGKLDPLAAYLRDIESHTKSSADTLKKLAPIKAASGYEGIVTSPRLFLAGESGPERVSIAPTGSPAYAGAGAQGGKPFVVNVISNTYLDGKLIYSQTKRQLIQDSKLAGGLPLDTKSFVTG